MNGFLLQHRRKKHGTRLESDHLELQKAKLLETACIGALDASKREAEPIMDPATFVVAEQAVSTTVEGAAVAGIGLAQSTQPLNATFTRITSEAFLPRSSHSIAVIAGKAYIFGGEDPSGKLADDNIHVIKLPAKKPSNVDDPEYKCLPSLSEEEDGKVPGPRTGHTACALGHRIYVFGGKGQDKQVLEENGKVWVFDTDTLRWNSLEPSTEDPYPSSRYQHSAVASEHPLPNTNVSDTASYTEQIKSTVSKIPAMIGKASPPREPHGSIIVCSGLSSSSGPLTDVWTFTVATKTWSAFPSISPMPFPPSLAFANQSLYILGGSSKVGNEIHYLQLQPSTYRDARGTADLDLKAKTSEWSTLPFPTNPLAPGPRPRKGAGLLPVTTGNGRLYLLYFMGEKVSEAEKGAQTEYWSDTWSYQIPAVDVAAAGIKDKTRSMMGISTGEGTWSEVKVVPNEEGSGGLETEGKSHPGPRGWFASCALGKDFDGGGVVLWGGINAKGETEGEGWIVSVK
ncbi:MAG: hypothetical protein LQ343_005852 [Gyalolechia ehrenbergii]|nr:MAG: hypothetical protein LQ343_005852 [Gyalolechia ehrenbergii]